MFDEIRLSSVAGATRFESQPNAEHRLILADPAGNPFCPTTVDEFG